MPKKKAIGEIVAEFPDGFFALASVYFLFGKGRYFLLGS
jgi:hypothetical protein